MKFSVKKSVIFFEKPGCAGNARQKALFDELGIEYVTKSILDNPWSKEGLNAFFEEKEKEEIFNPFAPMIKRGELDTDKLNKEELVELMIETPILIKRPLIEIGKEKICGFDVEKINRLLNVNIAPDLTISTCQSSDSCKSV